MDSPADIAPRRHLASLQVAEVVDCACQHVRNRFGVLAQALGKTNLDQHACTDSPLSGSVETLLSWARQGGRLSTEPQRVLSLLGPLLEALVGTSDIDMATLRLSEHTAPRDAAAVLALSVIGRYAIEVQRAALIPVAAVAALGSCSQRNVQLAASDGKITKGPTRFYRNDTALRSWLTDHGIQGLAP